MTGAPAAAAAAAPPSTGTSGACRRGDGERHGRRGRGRPRGRPAAPHPEHPAHQDIRGPLLAVGVLRAERGAARGPRGGAGPRRDDLRHLHEGHQLCVPRTQGAARRSRGTRAQRPRAPCAAGDGRGGARPGAVLGERGRHSVQEQPRVRGSRVREAVWARSRTDMDQDYRGLLTYGSSGEAPPRRARRSTHT